MIRYNHGLNGHEFEQTPGDSGGQRSLVCSSPWGCKESEMTEQQRQCYIMFFPPNFPSNALIFSYFGDV